jgi:hypothetical protein
VDHGAPVHVGERPGHAPGERERLVHAEPPPPEQRGEIFAVEPLHDEVLLVQRRGALGDVADDGRVAETGDHLGLPLEPGAVFGRGPAQDLDGDGRAASEVDRLEDLAHSPRSREASDLELPPDPISWPHRARSAPRVAGVNRDE